MLILPAENRLDWSRPPVATLALIVINCLVFFAYQVGDWQRIEYAVASYQDLELPERELDLYREWRETDAPDWTHELSEEDVEADPDTEVVLTDVIFDLEFERWLRREADSGFADDEDWQWRREEFENRRDRISAFALGLIPQDSRPLTFLTSQFLHGGLGHLLGNMIFLFLFGFALEAAIGRLRFVGLYLVCGIFAGLTHVAFEWGSPMPVVGASGAVSGLMGMYLAAYGWRRISFFYWIGFYYNYLRAPAIVMLPVWLGKEIYEAVFATAPVAYWAHAGGIFSGFVILALWRFGGLEIDRQALGEETDSQRQRRQDEQQLMTLTQQMELDKARDLAGRMVSRDPDDLELSQRYLKLLQSRPDAEAARRLLGSLARIPGMDARVVDLCEEAVVHWRKVAGPEQSLEPVTAGKLLVKLVWGARPRPARMLIAEQARAGHSRRLEPEMLARLAAMIESGGDPEAAAKLRALAKRNRA